MNLAEALQQIRDAEMGTPASSETSFDLLCGFTPLHLEQLLKARLYQRDLRAPIRFRHGINGDLTGSLEMTCGEIDSELSFVIVTWEDLDPRLGLRQADGRPSLSDDIFKTATWRLRQIKQGVAARAERHPVILAMPNAPALRFASTSPSQANTLELQLQAACAEASLDLALIDRVRLVSPPQAVAPCDHYDPRADLRFGIPYSVTYFDALATNLARLAIPMNLPLRGLITDLDDTFWRGLIGEIGADSVSWSLEKRSHSHALYQQLLRTLEEMGILLAIASKNDVSVALEGLLRSDCLVSADTFYPQEIHWNPKSESVARILKTWNISADAVVFIDDSASEIEEVQRAHPNIHAYRFPTGDDASVLKLLATLRDLFAKSHILESDRLRAASVRAGTPLELDEASDHEAFLAATHGKLRIEVSMEPDNRAFELLNKTNQFNLNGKRLSEKAWMDLLKAPDIRLLKASYEDKFGSLGKVGILIGRKEETNFTVTQWVLSCRAFSRRIEHAMLLALFELWKPETLRFDYRATERNQALTRFLEEIMPDKPGALSMLRRSDFSQACPPTHLSVHLNHEPS
ncbi:MAG: HAD-IIIC family phosphatase [Verrucomicrobiae bacterium]|nr:HAD-IIIC family phosphatase [Verrucomicrobiae bacterium]